jgi:multidrug efflux pump subunit AcrB
MKAAEAALEAARLRLRPILMTSFAVIFGVIPLITATGQAPKCGRLLAPSYSLA